MDFIDELERRLRALEGELESVSRELLAVTARQQELKSARDAALTMLERERKQTGAILHTAPLPENPVLFEKPAESKTDMMRQIVRENAASGVAPSDVWKRLKAKNITMHRNYVYSVLNRLKDKGEVTERNGRYYPAPVQ